MTYDPNIPQATDNISDSQLDILTNFSQIGTLFGSNVAADHYSFSDPTSAYRALHKQVTFPVPLGAAPAPASPKGIIYPLADPNDTSTRTQMYFKNGSTTEQMTNRFSDASSSGYIMFAGSKDNIIAMWGQENTPSSGNYPIIFPSIANYVGSPVGFPNNVFHVYLTVEATSSLNAPAVVVSQGTLASTGFTLRVSTSLANTVTHWFAIGN